MRTYVTFIDKLNALVTAIVAALLCVVSLAVMTQVMVRFVLTALNVNISAPWTEELARYTLIWMVFLGAAVGVRHAREELGLAGDALHRARGVEVLA